MPISAASATPWTNVSQGEAIQACQSLGSGYHLISENEWLTIAENIISESKNDIDVQKAGMQLYAAATTHVLTNKQRIFGLTGGYSEWTNKVIRKQDLIEPISNEWQDYSRISSFKSLDEIIPPYYMSLENGIGFIKTGENDNNTRAFARGANGIYSLDLSNPPSLATSTIGFRCAK